MNMLLASAGVSFTILGWAVGPVFALILSFFVFKVAKKIFMVSAIVGGVGVFMFLGAFFMQIQEINV